MIQGFKVTVGATELRVLVEDRVLYHRDRAKFYAEKAIALDGVGDLNEGQSSIVSPLKQMQDKREQHERDAEELAWMGAHLDPAEQYVLDRSDLARLGILKSAY